MKLELHLCAIDSKMAAAWSVHFDKVSNVHIHKGDILERSGDAILSPANSFGFMDGGIDLAYSRFFGWQLQERLRGLIDSRHAGELPVGCAEIVATDNARFPRLVSAPTMRVPADISDTVNVYLAFRAALLAVVRSNEIATLVSPSLGTGVGGMSYERAAKQMHAAYAEVILGETEWRATARGALRHHSHLLS